MIHCFPLAMKALRMVVILLLTMVKMEKVIQKVKFPNEQHQAQLSHGSGIHGRKPRGFGNSQEQGEVVLKCD